MSHDRIPPLRRVKEPVSKAEESAAAEAFRRSHGDNNYYTDWYAGPWLRGHTSDATNGLVEAYHLVASGKGTFRHRCKGGPLHRVVIEPSGSVSFPDHTEVSQVLGVIAGETHLPSCDEVRAALRESRAERVERQRTTDRHLRNAGQDGITRLWGNVVSAAPGWAQLLEFLKSSLADERESRAAERKRETFATRCQNLAAATMLSDAKWRAALGNPVTIMWVEPKALVPGTVVQERYLQQGRGAEVKVLAANLPFPDGWEAYQYCRNQARHGTHVDVVPTVRGLKDSADPFPTVSRLVAMTGCPAEGARPSLLVRDEAGWRVSE